MTVSFVSAKIEDMRSLSWPLAAVAITAMLVVGTLAVLDKDIAAVSSAIMTLLLVLGIAELREIKSNTNGTNLKMMEELAQYRRQNERITDRALSSPPLTPPEQQ